MRSKQNPKGAGRKELPASLKKIKLHNFRLPRWIVDWLLSNKGKGSQLLEEAVVNYFNLKYTEVLSMEDIVQEVIARIPSSCIFDSHFVISQIHSQYPEDYADFVGESDDMAQATKAAHGNIAKLISRLDGIIVEKLDNQSWSETIYGTPNRCAGWLKL